MSIATATRGQITTAMAPLRQRWHRLETRQQRLLGAGTLLLIFSLLFAFVWLPAVRERDRLLVRLPQLNAELALMQKQADEIRQLNSTSLVTAAPPIVADIATLQAVFGEGVRVSLEPNRAFRIVIPKIAYAAWWDRLGEVQSRHQLQIVSLSLAALPGKNREVSIDMILAEGGSVSGNGNPASVSPASGVSK